VPSKAGKTIESSVECFFRQVLNALKSGRNVVCPISSKSIVKQLHTYLISQSDMQSHDMQFYHSESSSNQLRIASMNPEIYWKDLRLLAYSPTISSGVSYELPTFHEKIAYFVNSPKTAGVDICVQQMMRVRLTSFPTTVYIQTPAPNITAFVTLKEVEDSLHARESWVRGVCPINSCLGSAREALWKKHDEDTQISVFDKRDVLYRIFMGHVTRKSMSQHAFTEMFVNAMRDDAGFDVVVERLVGLEVDLQDPLVKQMRKKVGTELISNLVLVDGKKLDELVANSWKNPDDRDADIKKQLIYNERMCAMRGLSPIKFPPPTPLEKLEEEDDTRPIDVSEGCTQIPENLENLFANVLNTRHVNASFARVFREECTREMVSSTLEESLDVRMAAVKGKDAMMYEMLVGTEWLGRNDMQETLRASQCWNLMKAVFGEDCMQHFSPHFSMDRAEFQSRVHLYLLAMSKKESKEFAKLFNIRNMAKVLEGDAKSRRLLLIFRKVLKVTCCIEYLTPKACDGKRNNVCFSLETYNADMELLKPYLAEE
jgi:hypothetical protein